MSATRKIRGISYLNLLPNKLNIEKINSKKGELRRKETKLHVRDGKDEKENCKYTVYIEINCHIEKTNKEHMWIINIIVTISFEEGSTTYCGCALSVMFDSCIYDQNNCNKGLVSVLMVFSSN